MSLYHLLNGRNYGVYNRYVAKAIGLHATILLSEIIDKFEKFLEDGSLIQIPDQEGYWFYLTAETIEDRTTLTEKEQRSPLNKLVELGLIKKIISGLPAKRYFQIDQEKISEFVTSKIKTTSLDKRPDWFGQNVQTGLDKRPNSPIYKNPNKKPKEKLSKESLETPPSISHYEGKYENKIKISSEQRNDIIKNLDITEECFDSMVENLYEYGLNFPKKFKAYSRHDLTVKKWIKKDLENFSKKSSSHSILNDIQKKNWELNQKLVNDLKAQVPHKAAGLHFFYKNFILKDKNDHTFDLCGYIDFMDFARLLSKHLKVNIHIPEENV